MGAGLFWGLILVLIGLGLIIKIAFNIDFPFFKVLIAFFFIYIGFRILFGSFGLLNIRSGSDDVIFHEKSFKSFDKKKKEYNVIFGRGVYDFRNITFHDNKSIKAAMHTVFGSSVIRIDKDTPLKIKVDAAFAGAKLPNGNSAVFGSSYYQSENFNPDSAHLYIKADVVFGGLEIISE